MLVCIYFGRWEDISKEVFAGYDGDYRPVERDWGDGVGAKAVECREYSAIGCADEKPMRSIRSAIRGMLELR